MFVAHFADPFTKLWKLGGIFLKAMTFLLSEISLIYIQGYVCRLVSKCKFILLSCKATLHDVEMYFGCSNYL